MAVPQLANIAFGFYAAIPLLLNIASFKKLLTNLQSNWKKHEATFSYILLALLALNLIQRFFIYFPFFTGSHPQSLGLFLLFILYTPIALFASLQKALSPFASWIGVLAFLIGFFSLV